VPPVVNKVFADYPRLGVIWRHAYKEISDAAEIHILGFSLADTDYSIHWLLRSALSSLSPPRKPTIRIANRNKCESQKVKDKLERLLRGVDDLPEIKTYDGIEDYVERSSN
jgi:hypothetical protein